MKKSTTQTKTNVSISGGTKKMRYFINGGIYTQGGLFKEFGQDYKFGYQYSRFNYRANLDLDVTSTTTLSFNIAGNVDNSNKPNTGQGASGMVFLMKVVGIRCIMHCSLAIMCLYNLVIMI